MTALMTLTKALAEQAENMTFIGRCGTYQYLDMHQVINQSMMGVRWVHDRGSKKYASSRFASAGAVAFFPHAVVIPARIKRRASFN
jgi:hypothetical protein